MYIIAHWNSHFIHTGCVMCGERFELAEIAYDVIEEESPHELLGAVCESCIVLSEADMRQQLHAAADALRHEAEDLEALAAEPIHLPPPQQIRPTRRQVKRMHDEAHLDSDDESLTAYLQRQVLERKREGY